MIYFTVIRPMTGEFRENVPLTLKLSRDRDKAVLPSGEHFLVLLQFSLFPAVWYLVWFSHSSPMVGTWVCSRHIQPNRVFLMKFTLHQMPLLLHSLGSPNLISEHLHPQVLLSILGWIHLHQETPCYFK